MKRYFNETDKENDVNPMKIVLIGAGNLATNLGKSLLNKGHDILQVYSRTMENAAALADIVGGSPTNDISNVNPEADVYIISIKDSAISEIVPALCKEKEEKVFPGYVLVEMIMDEETWYVVRHTTGVAKFVGSAKKPIPAKDSEIKKIINRSSSQTQKIELDVKVGDKVRITSGPFAEFVADIIEVYPDKAKLRANVSIFGRETPVELEYKQINKL